MNPRQRHNKRVKAMTIIVVMIAIFSIMLLDSDTWIPCITLGVSLVWICLFYLANKE